ncbi:MAG: hypothetical protein KBI34_08750 [Dictyoglomi bacterium]|nr:hypothetical protein [Dictyoglomota bacterium]HOK30387.1 hypothetical protein [bacterium]HOL55724.1 hypothetical protein [bacterium]
MPELEEKVGRLESLLGQFIINNDVALRRLETSLEAFKDEMRAFKNEVNEDRKRMNKMWGELANKMGTLVEDIVAPNIAGVARRYFGAEELEDFMIRRRKRNTKDKNKVREFDVIAVWDDKVIINETKSTPRIDYINDFIDVLKEITDYFPEYRDKQIIPIFSSLYLPEDIVDYLTRNKIYAMGMNDDTMDLLNFEKVK